jgi:hypothetical protein
MKKSVLVLMMSLMGLGMCMTSCDDDSYQKNDLSFFGDREVTLQVMNKENLPAWLTEMIDELADKQEKSMISSRIMFYKFSWEGEDYYTYVSDYTAILSHVFTIDGNLIELDYASLKRINEDSKDWKCIYILDYTSPLH